MAKTDEDGRFTIENLPVGMHQIRLWHEMAGYVGEIRLGTDCKMTFVKRGRLEVAIEPGQNNLGDLHVSPSLFQKSSSKAASTETSDEVTMGRSCCKCRRGCFRRRRRCCD